jgi:hypothetical protein
LLNKLWRSAGYGVSAPTEKKRSEKFMKGTQVETTSGERLSDDLSVSTLGMEGLEHEDEEEEQEGEPGDKGMSPSQ